MSVTLLDKITTDENGDEAKKEYEMYSQVLSKLSTFVDTALSINMRGKETKSIVFNDVTPEIFELAIKIEEDSFAARSMTLEDAIKVVLFYHMYEFPTGLKPRDFQVRLTGAESLAGRCFMVGRHLYLSFSNYFCVRRYVACLYEIFVRISKRVVAAKANLLGLHGGRESYSGKHDGHDTVARYRRRFSEQS
jgi:hypothetical protein